MVSHISVQVGLDPWEPALETKMVEVYSKYEVPLTGVVCQSERFYIFRCIRGELEELSLWAYAPVTESEVELLKDADDVELKINRLTTGKFLTVALSHQEEGIIASWRLRPVPFSIFDSEAMTRAAQEQFFTASRNLTAVINSLQ
jgi:hypothetical protein